MNSDVAGFWDVPLSDGVHQVEFEHGTATGRRVIRVDNKVVLEGGKPSIDGIDVCIDPSFLIDPRSATYKKELLRRDWMFKLVGDEVFYLGKTRCVIRVEPSGSFSYDYTLLVDGKSLHKFTETQAKTKCTWLVQLPDNLYRVVLEKDTLDIWANGKKLDAMGEFVDNGTETHFSLGDTPACIKAVTSCNRKEGLIHSLIVRQEIIPPESN